MRRSALIALVVVFSVSLFGQQKDFRTWWSVEGSATLFNTLDLEVAPEVRFSNNSRNLTSFLTDVEISYPFLEYFKVGGQYRIEQIYLGQNYWGNRFGVFARAKVKVDRFRISYRALYSWEYVGIQTTETGYLPDQYHRHKFSCSYYKKKWDLLPNCSVEYFVYLKPIESNYERKLRVAVGFDYKLTKDMDVSVDYKIQQEFFESNPMTAYILSTKLSYSF